MLQSGATLVVRPDSGNSRREVVVEVARRLAVRSAPSTNNAGYAVLNPQVRIIQGDGMDLEQIDILLGALTAAGFSADNVAFGMGGGLLQKGRPRHDEMGDEGLGDQDRRRRHDIFKDPVIEPGQGLEERPRLIRDAQGWRTVPSASSCRT